MKTTAFLSPAHPLRGGIASSTERLAREFQDQGYRVVIFTFSYQYPPFLFPGKTQYSGDPAPADLDIRVMVHSLNPLSWIKTGRAIRREKPELLIVRYWLPFLAPCLGSIARLSGTRNICIADNIIPHEKRPFDRLLTRYFTRAMHGFLALSKAVAEELTAFAGKKPVGYAPHPVYDIYGEPVDRAEAKKRLGFDPERNLILFFGFIRDYKGLDILLEAMADPRMEGLQLLVAGEFYGNEDKYRNLIRDLKIEEKVSIRDEYIPQDEVRYYFSAADLVVQPYKSATQSGISQLAYHFDRAMVVTHVGGLPEFVEHLQTGYVVAPEPRAVADAVFEFFHNLRQRAMETRVHAKKKEFSWGRVVEEVKRLQEEAV